MKRNFKRAMSLLLSTVLAVGLMAPAAYAEGGSEKKLVGDVAKGKYKGDYVADAENAFVGGGDMTPFTKISHPQSPASKMKYDPTLSPENRAKHQYEVFADGIVDYVGGGRLAPADPFADKAGPGDRGQTYTWSGLGWGDWMYVSTQYNSAGATGDLMGQPLNPEMLEERYGGDYWHSEKDGQIPGSTFSKINVKTGEVVILMSAKTNGLDTQFRGGIEYKGKLYFCGSVNHVPSIYEVDPTNDALQCIYQDQSMTTFPGGIGAAWKVARDDKKICPTIRGLTTFKEGDKEYLVISCVGMDENPYIAVSDDPSSGNFDIIAYTWKDVENKKKGELLGYPACHIPDSIFGGSIWEMAQVGDKLIVAMCTGTPENASYHYKMNDDGKYVDAEGNEITKEERLTKGVKVIDGMQSFALIVGSHDASKALNDASAWTWEPLAGDQEHDDAKYTFGIDPERTRAGACNLIVYKDQLYVGEYNDTQIAFQNMSNKEFTFLKRNMEQSISLYRLNITESGKVADMTFEKIMGNPTDLFPKSLSGVDNSGFGQHESQYFWQSKVFGDKMYFGTFDETMILYPLAREANNMQSGKMNEVGPMIEAMEQEVAAASAMSEDSAMYSARNKFDGIFRGIMNNIKKYHEVKGDVLLPAEVVNEPAAIKVNSPETLYQALLAAKQLVENRAEDDSITEKSASIMQFFKLQDEVAAYCATTEDEIPETMLAAATTFAGDNTKAKGDTAKPEPHKPGENDVNVNNSKQDIMYVFENLGGSIRGFDMYSTDDGVNYKQVTRSGMGDPYNQGLRVFAKNEDGTDNQWMAIGTANPFYGCQAWRMEHETFNKDIVTPAQVRVKVTFMKEGKKVVDRSKSQEIFVNAGVTEVKPETLAIMIPANHQLKSTEAVQIVDNAITVELVDAFKDVTVVYYKPGDTNLSTKEVVKVPSSRHYVTGNELKEVPEGFAVNDPAAKVKIKKTVGTDASEEGAPTVTYSARFDLVDAAAVHQATVNGGSGSGKYGEGVTVNIHAEVPEGKEFVEWVVGEAPVAPENPEATVAEGETDPAPVLVIKDANKKYASFVMPAEDVVVSAVYKEKGEAQKPAMKKIEMVGGVAKVEQKVEGSDETTEVEVTEAAPRTRVKVYLGEVPEGKLFQKWHVTSDGKDFNLGIPFEPRDKDSFFNMPNADIKIEAIFKDEFPITVVGGHADVETAYEGQGVNLFAEVPENKVFVEWTFGEWVPKENQEKPEDNEVIDRNKEHAAFKMPAKAVTATAVFADKTYTVTLKGGEGATGEMEALTATAGVPLELPANGFTAPEGKVFQSWQIGEKNYAVGAKVVFTADTDVTAVWGTEEIAKVAVHFDANGGTGEMADLSVPAGLIYTLPANGFTAPADKEFKAWQVGDMELAENAEHTFTEETTVKALWQDKVDANVTGTVTSYGAADAAVTVTLMQGDTVVATVEATDNMYVFEAVKPGTYTVKVEKANHVTREYTVEVGAESVTQDVVINLLGDVNGDGEVNQKDWERVYDHMNVESKQITDTYAQACADMNKDGEIDQKDWEKIYDAMNA